MKRSFSIALVLLVTFAPIRIDAAGSATKPIPNGPDCRVQKQYDEALRAFHRRIFVDGYKAVGHKNPAWDAQAIALAEALAKRVSGPFDGRGGLRNVELAQQAKALAALGCDDAIVPLAQGFSVDPQAYPDECWPLLREAMKRLEQQHYSPAASTLAALRLGLGLRTRKAGDESAAVGNSAAGSLLKCLDGSDFRPDEQRLLFRLVDVFFAIYTDSSYGDAQAVKDFFAKLGDLKHVDPWSASLARGLYYLRMAWFYRGGGYANQVAPQQMRDFEANLKLAIPELTAAHKLHPDRPEAATAMLEVCLGHSKDQNPESQPRTWFDRAVAAQMDWMQAYRGMQFALWPRWGGDADQVYRFGLECAGTKRFDTEVPYFFIQTLIDTAYQRSAKFDPEDWRKRNVYPQVNAVLEKLATFPGREAQRDFYRTMSFGFAWHCECYPEAKRAFEALGGNLDPIARGQLAMRDGDDAVVGEIYARTSPGWGKIEHAQQLAARSDVQGAGRAYEEALATPGMDARAIAFVRTKMSSSSLRDRLRHGETVDLTFDKALTGYLVQSGRWEADGTSAVKGTSMHKGLGLFLDVPLEPRYQLTGKVEFIETKFAKFNAGILMWPAKQQVFNRFGFAFYLQEKQMFGLDMASKIRIEHDVPVEKENAFDLTVTGAEMIFILNGKEIYRGPRGTGSGPDTTTERIGFGGAYWFDGSVIRFSDLKLRVLKGNEVPPHRAGPK